MACSLYENERKEFSPPCAHSQFESEQAGMTYSHDERDRTLSQPYDTRRTQIHLVCGGEQRRLVFRTELV